MNIRMGGDLIAADTPGTSKRLLIAIDRDNQVEWTRLFSVEALHSGAPATVDLFAGTFKIRGLRTICGRVPHLGDNAWGVRSGI
nr:hypothetical protein Iba_chr04dCG3280 [Ipomoea batatas]